MKATGGKKNQQGFLIPHVRLPINALIIINDFFPRIDVALSRAFFSIVKLWEGKRILKQPRTFFWTNVSLFILLLSEAVV